MKKALCIIMTLAVAYSCSVVEKEDPYLWLEEVDGKEAIEWAESMNSKSLEILMSHPEFEAVYTKNLEILNSSDRIAAPAIYDDFIYNFWQDAENVRGIWRRTSKQSYLQGNPSWETLIDIDKLSKQDDIKWVYKGATGLYPDYKRFMVSLSKGGGDAVVIREFDPEKKAFIDNGFELPEAKGGVSWIDENTLLVFSDFGEGTLTTSGYARQVKRWQRGTSIAQAPVIFEGEEQDVSVSGFAINKPGRQYLLFSRGLDFFTSEKYVLENDEMVLLDIPNDASVNDIFKEQVIISLKSDWEVDGHSYKQGSLISADYDELIQSRYKTSLIVEPNDRSGIVSISSTLNTLLINMISNVISELNTFSLIDGQWVGKKFDAPPMGTIRVGSSGNNSDEFFFYYENFLTPSSLFFAHSVNNTRQLVQSLPAFFDAEKYQVWQYEAKSADGTMIPYFVVGPKDLQYNGANPTHLNAYGGFEVSRLPFYSAINGNSWLERGGVYVLANIRGGGEFGPGWHQAGLKENRQRIYDDFHAVAEDLIARKITSGQHLGIQGGSNGGLLVGVAFTQRPELYNAVVCQVPLLDMQRYNKLLAGASWMGEYGDPDIPEEWEYIRKYSPYHNLKKNQKYPEVFFTTSTRDDRVHPGHARKMVAKMIDMGYNVYYFENMEGGHAGASTNEQRAKTSALGTAYLLMKLKK
jgi:prolyl oligopeptidase